MKFSPPNHLFEIDKWNVSILLVGLFVCCSFHKDVLNGVAPYFVFGDFNFRCDTEGVVKVSQKNIFSIRHLKCKHTPQTLESIREAKTNALYFCVSFIQKLAEDLTIHRILNVKNDHYKVQYRDGEAQNVLTIGKKEFHHVEHQSKFKESWVSHKPIYKRHRFSKIFIQLDDLM